MTKSTYTTMLLTFTSLFLSMMLRHALTHFKTSFTIFSNRRHIATKVLGKNMLQGFTLEDTLCKDCCMPLMQKPNSLEIVCVVCPVLAKKTKKMDKHIRAQQMQMMEAQQAQQKMQLESERAELESQRIRFIIQKEIEQAQKEQMKTEQQNFKMQAEAVSLDVEHARQRQSVTERAQHMDVDEKWKIDMAKQLVSAMQHTQETDHSQKNIHKKKLEEKKVQLEEQKAKLQMARIEAERTQLMAETMRTDHRAKLEAQRVEMEAEKAKLDADVAQQKIQLEVQLAQLQAERIKQKARLEDEQVQQNVLMQKEIAKLEAERRAHLLAELEAEQIIAHNELTRKKQLEAKEAEQKKEQETQRVKKEQENMLLQAKEAAILKLKAENDVKKMIEAETAEKLALVKKQIQEENELRERELALAQEVSREKALKEIEVNRVRKMEEEKARKEINLQRLERDKLVNELRRAKMETEREEHRYKENILRANREASESRRQEERRMIEHSVLVNELRMVREEQAKKKIIREEEREQAKVREEETKRQEKTRYEAREKEMLKMAEQMKLAKQSQITEIELHKQALAAAVVRAKAAEENLLAERKVLNDEANLMEEKCVAAESEAYAVEKARIDVGRQATDALQSQEKCAQQMNQIDIQTRLVELANTGGMVMRAVNGRPSAERAFVKTDTNYNSSKKHHQNAQGSLLCVAQEASPKEGSRIFGQERMKQLTVMQRNMHKKDASKEKKKFAGKRVSRAVSNGSSSSKASGISAKENRCGELANEEIERRLLQGWKLLHSPCTTCLHPLMSEFIDGPELCVFCEFEDNVQTSEETNYRDDYSSGIKSSAKAQLDKAASRGHRRGQLASRRDDPEPTGLSLSHLSQQSPIRSGVSQQQKSFLPQRQRYNATPPRQTSEGKLFGATSSSRNHERSRSKCRSVS